MRITESLAYPALFLHLTGCGNPISNFPLDANFSSGANTTTYSTLSVTRNSLTDDVAPFQSESKGVSKRQPSFPSINASNIESLQLCEEESANPLDGLTSPGIIVENDCSDILGKIVREQYEERSDPPREHIEPAYAENYSVPDVTEEKVEARKQAEAVSRMYADIIVLEPQEKHEATVIMLHDKGGDANTMVSLGADSWIESLRRNTKFISIGSDSHSWFDLVSESKFEIMRLLFSGQEIVSRGTLDLSCNKLAALIDSEAFTVGHSKVFLLGYSQGGVVAIWTALMSASKQIGGVVAINAAVPIQNIGNVSNPGVPIAHFHGENNKVIPIKLARKGREVAELAGAKAYTFIENQGGHDLSLGVSREISLWLSRNIA